MSDSPPLECDIAIIGGGAAGLATAVFAARRCPSASILILDGAKRLGAKILISGGGRCNVTNVKVTAKDFCGGSKGFVKRILKALPVKHTISLFEELGVSLHEEEHGKLFPDSNKARSVLDALINETTARGVQLLTEHRVERIERQDQHFEVCTSQQHVRAKQIVLATGGKSVPKTGSDGFGFELAKSLGHQIEPQFPSLVPLLLGGEFYAELSGVSQIVELTLHANDTKPQRFTGSMLWTHFGLSGPVVLDISRHWHAANLRCATPTVTANFFSGENFQSLEELFLQWTSSQPSTRIRKKLSEYLPARFVDALLEELGIPTTTNLSEFKRTDRRALTHQLIARELPVTGSRGFRYAEVTAGGIPLSEVNPSTMESRCTPGLFLVGEILNIDGRLGGFNFQWAWSTAKVAAEGMRKMIHAANGETTSGSDS